MKFDLSSYLTSLTARIETCSETYYQDARRHLDDLTKPRGSLGRLEDIAAQIYAIRAGRIDLPLRCGVCVFAADHGVTEEGVSAYPSAVTAQMVHNFLRGGAAINVLSRHCGAAIRIVDVGVDATFEDAPELVQAKVRRGSRNLRREAAMSEEEVAEAIGVGVRMAEEAADKGLQVVAGGEMGIGNTTAASAIAAMLTGLSVASLTGYGTGLDDVGKSRKMQVIEEALALHFGEHKISVAPLEILRCVGGLEIAAMTGFMLEAAAQHMAVICDGFIATSAAAVACAINPNVKEYLLAGHCSEEPGHAHLLRHIGIEPILQLNMRLGEGTGAVLAMPLIESALRLFKEMATFSSAGISEKNT
jgi:nicotinate-nucleotide--dimethylbenzimidazole phosphoribosyltransferase